MARSSECKEQYAQKVLDTADIVRDACLHQSVDIQRLERSGAYLLILDLTNVTYALFQRSDIFLKCV